MTTATFGISRKCVIRLNRFYLGFLQRQLIEDLEIHYMDITQSIQLLPRLRLDHNSIFPVLLFCREGSDTTHLRIPTSFSSLQYLEQAT